MIRSVHAVGSLLKGKIFRFILGMVFGVVGHAGAKGAVITFNKNFEGASLGKIEKIGDAQFRCAVEGQYDERGRNRQATWYSFRMDGVLDREVTLTLTDLVGEYNDKPGTCAMNPETVPVFSYDNEHWQHFPSMQWDDVRKEATLKLRFQHDRVWIAHVPPYPWSRLRHLLEELERKGCVTDEVIGRTVQGRELNLLTVTDFEQRDDKKKIVWMIARQHAWEAGTSFVMEGALRFITSDKPKARALRQKVVFKFLPMMDPDGCASGKVRFNANGYDVNRHWNEVDLRHGEYLEKMPEIWYCKKALVSFANSGKKIDLMLNLHNTETAEYLHTMVDDPAIKMKMERLFHDLASDTSFDPNEKGLYVEAPSASTNSLWKDFGIPVLLMEQRIGTSPKLHRRLLSPDRLEFGENLIAHLAQAVLAE